MVPSHLLQADSPPVSLQWEPVQAQDVKLKKAIVTFEGFHSWTCPPWTTSNSLVFFQLCLTSDWFLRRLLLVGFSCSKLWFTYLPVSLVCDGRCVVRRGLPCDLTSFTNLRRVLISQVCLAFYLLGVNAVSRLLTCWTWHCFILFSFHSTPFSRIISHTPMC